ncbi:MAG: ATP-binding cassette domain-containing protein [Arachnia sp.]
MDNVATISEVSKAFKGLQVLEDVNLAVPCGSLLGIQGANGSGKSVLFKLMIGLMVPDTGTVWISPELKDKGDAYPTNVGVIIDRPGYLPNLTGLENLLELAAIRKKASRADVEAAMERVGLSPGVRQVVRHYSLGMKQKLAIAQSFMENQQLLLLDEAFNGLDATSVEATRVLLRDLHQEGRTIVITSHQQSDIDALCDSVWRIDNRTLVPVSADGA